MKRILILTVLTAAMLSMYVGTAFAAGWWVEYGSGVTGDGRITAPTSGADGANATLDSRSMQDPDGTGPSGPIPLGNMGQGNPNTADGGTTPEPHGGYTITTNMCKTCHAVHGANANSFRLLHDTGRTTECDWCHNATTGRSKHRPYGELALRGRSVRGEHSIGATMIPDSTKNDALAGTVGDNWGALPGYGDGISPSGLNCYVCHSVHGANIMDEGATGWPIVRADPQRDGGAGLIIDHNGFTQTYSGPGAQQVSFCADCHNKNPNFGDDSQATTGGTTPSRPNAAAHPTRGDGLVEVYGQSNVQVSPGTLTNCASCHSATSWNGGGGTSDFPHQTVGHKLLEDAYTDASLQGASDTGDPMRALPNMDKICLGCHGQVGTTF